MAKIQRKIVSTSVDGDQDRDEKRRKVYRLKNILPTGKIVFNDEQGKGRVIDADKEFDVNEVEIEEMLEYQAFKEGCLIFTKTYPDHNGFSNCMADDKIKELTSLSIKKFEKEIDKLDSYYIFGRIRKVLVETSRPSGYLQYVDLREANLKAEWIKSQQYQTDAERNRELFTRPISR